MRDKGEFLFTSESVSEGHPDKVADRISDTVLDTFLAADPYSRVACETLGTTNRIVLAGETSGPDTVTHERLAEQARQAVREIGYDQAGFSWRTVDVAVYLHVDMRIETACDRVRAVGVYHPNVREAFGNRLLVQEEIQVPQAVPGEIEFAHLRQRPQIRHE